MNNYEQEDFKKVKNGYYMYLAGPLTMYITSFFGYIKAMKQRNNIENSVIVNNHYSYQFKIMNINIILNLIILLTALSYTFNIIAEIDFVNLNLDSFMSEITNIFQFYLVGSVLITGLLFVQSWIGLHKINNNTYV